MGHRVLAVCVVTFALTLGAVSCRSAPATHQGKVVAVGAGTLTMTDTAGANQHTHNVDSTAAIICEGKPCGLNELKAGDLVTVTTDTKEGRTLATRIEARKALS